MSISRTTHAAFEPLELIDRLAALIPPSRFHTVRYHGVLASRSKHRAQVVPKLTELAARLPCGAGTCAPERGRHCSVADIAPENRRDSTGGGFAVPVG